MNQLLSKRCNSCRVVKELSEFHRRKDGDGFQYKCRVCQRMARADSRAKAAGRDNDGRFAVPDFVECLMCGEPARCHLDNAYWLNQYSDHMANTYHALCSDKCFARLGNVMIRMRRLTELV